MSTINDLKAANRELDDARRKLSLAGGTMVAAMALGTVMNCDTAAFWQIVAARRLAKLTRDFTASTLAAADQLTEELKAINRMGQLYE